MSDEHDAIAQRVAETFISAAYVHTTHLGHEWAIGTPTVEITPESLRAAIAQSVALFAREYGLKPK